MTIFRACHHQTFDCPVGVWVIEQRAIILSATVRSPTVIIHECYFKAKYFVENMIALVVVKQPWRMWVYRSPESFMKLYYVHNTTANNDDAHKLCYVICCC